MAETARYVAIVGPGVVEHREMPLPEVGDEMALLRVESCGVCGSDVRMVRDHDPASTPIAPGHEPVGRIERIGSAAARQWQLGVGDRVAVNARWACHRCAACRRGEYCTELRGPTGIAGHGFLSADLGPPLSGGFASHLLVSSLVEVVPVPDSVSVAAASLFNALANGFAWAVEAGGVRPGQRVAVLGPGPRGTACAVAARTAGAGEVHVTGLRADRERLDFVARLTGAVPWEVDDDTDMVETARSWGSFDVVIDTTPGSAAATELALQVAGHGATVVLAGLKGGRTAAFDVDTVIMRELTVRGARSSGSVATRMAVDALARHEYDFDAWASHAYALADFTAAIDASAGGGSQPRPLHVRVEPDLDEAGAV